MTTEPRQMTEKTFNVTIRVAHDEGLPDHMAVNAVLVELREGIEELVFPIFARTSDDEEYEIEAVAVEVF